MQIKRHVEQVRGGASAGILGWDTTLDSPKLPAGTGLTTRFDDGLVKEHVKHVARPARLVSPTGRVSHVDCSWAEMSRHC